MPTKQTMIDTARTWINTPYHHQGRVKGIGVDCCGLIIGIAQELGLSYYDITGYSRFADGITLLNEFATNCSQVDNYQPGDILIFRIKKRPQHCAILAERNGQLTIIHAYQTINKVVEHDLTDWWQDRIVRAFEFPNIN